MADRTEPLEPDDDPADDTFSSRDATPFLGTPDLSGLPIAGITRRRVGLLGAAFLTAWVVIVFARQVGDAAAADARVDALRQANAALEGNIAALEREYRLIQRQEWVVQQARGYRLGDADEVAFTLVRDAPLPPDAPGSAALRLGADDGPRTPLESWLSLLFGPGD